MERPITASDTTVPYICGYIFNKNQVIQHSTQHCHIYVIKFTTTITKLQLKKKNLAHTNKCSVYTASFFLKRLRQPKYMYMYSNIHIFGTQIHINYRFYRRTHRTQDSFLQPSYVVHCYIQHLYNDCFPRSSAQLQMSVVYVLKSGTLWVEFA